MPKYRLVSFKICPFVQRAAIVLQAKNVDYDIEYIDLRNKPDWFLELSPLGKVPILEVDDTVLFESQVIAEYLDEVEGPSMHPQSPLERAKHRAFIEVVSTALGDSWRMTMVETKDEVDKLVDQVGDRLRRVAEAHSGGKFFAGDSLSLVDAAAAPLLQRLTWNEDVGGLDILGAHPRLAPWRDALLEHPAVVASTVPEVRELGVELFRGWLGQQRA